LLCDSDDRWINSYTQKIGTTCNAFHAEIWGMYIWMNEIGSKMRSHLLVENNSKLLIDDMVKRRCNLSGATPFWFVEYMSLSTWIGRLDFSTSDGKATEALAIIVLYKIFWCFNFRNTSCRSSKYFFLRHIWGMHA
jgi:hypothetical protein